MRRITILLGLAVLFLAPVVWADVPKLINFQGILRDGSGNPVANGSYSTTFTIYDAPAGGTSLWSETQSVTTTNGLFTVLLGAVNPVPDSVFKDTLRWLGVAVSPDPEMTPRQQLVSVAYGFRISSVDGASGGNITSKVSIGPGHTNTGTDAFVAGANNNARGDYSTVSGGGGPLAADSNTATGFSATVSGGFRNIASNTAATVGGGSSNLATGYSATVGGGDLNTSMFDHATVGGGTGNTANGASATVGGGAQNSAIGYYSTVSGGTSNTAGGASSFRATVGGGGDNTASGDHATVAGGSTNTANAIGATVGGGASNQATGQEATVGGGNLNRATNTATAVGGGYGNFAAAPYSTIGGGYLNIASGFYSTIPGGAFNQARSTYSFAAGYRAIANFRGNFVWADSSVDADFTSTANNQFLIRASGGVGIGTNSPASQLHVHDPTNTINGSRLSLTQAVGGSTATDGMALICTSPNGYMWNYENGQLFFGTNNAERMRITAAGSVGIGTASPSARLHVKGAGYPNSYGFFDTDASGQHAGVYFYEAGSPMSYLYHDAVDNTLKLFGEGASGIAIASNGSVGIGTAAPAALLHVNGTAGNNTGVWSNLSDRRLKKEIEPMRGALESVLQLKGVTFRWKDEAMDAEFGRVRGLVAQDVEKVIPEWIKTDPDGHKRLEPIGIDALLIEAVKEQQQTIENLQTEVNGLKELVEKLLSAERKSIIQPASQKSGLEK